MQRSVCGLFLALHLAALCLSRGGQHSAIVERTTRLSTNVSLRMVSTGDPLLFAPFLTYALYFTYPVCCCRLQHEDAVTSGCVSPDGIKVAVGTAHGSVGVLDVSSHAYDTLMRSHAKTIVAVASRPNKHLAFHGAYHTRVACFP